MNTQEENVEYVQNSGEIESKAPKRIRIVALIICFLIALMVWFYAQNADDPLTENNMNVVYTCNDESYECSGSVQNVEVYGVQSVIYKYNSTNITVNVDVKNGIVQEVNIELPEGIHFKDKTKNVSTVSLQKKALI